MNRHQRRAAQAHGRKVARDYRKAVTEHSCVLEREAIEVDVVVELSIAEHHAFHQARGETRCPACPACRDGHPALADDQRAVVSDAWLDRLTPQPASPAPAPRRLEADGPPDRAPGLPT